MPGLIRAARRPPGWLAPGPLPLGAASGAVPQDDEDVCFLTGQWQLFQKQRGHRWSLDDLITAHVATSLPIAPAQCLDLGCGIGSVLLMIAWRFPSARCVGIEAQAVSAALARKSIAWNGVATRVELLEGDFRDVRPDGRFELVTGTPPYFPIGTGTLSEKTQAPRCRFEHRGGVEAYCLAAERALGAAGTFVFCEGAGQVPRVEAALASAGLHLRACLDVLPRAGKQPLLNVFTAQRAPGQTERSELTVRDLRGQWTPRFLEVRAAMGMPPSPRSS